jgi:hypothetical protein
MNSVLLGLAAWCAVSIPAGFIIGRWLRASGTEHPAPADPLVPGTTPVPGGAPDTAADPPLRPPPAPGLPDDIYGQCVMVTYFFDTGITVTDELARMRRFVDIPPADEWGPDFLKDIAP